MAGFATVRRLTRHLTGVEESTAYGSPCLKTGGRMFACIAVHKSAEPDTLMVRVSSFEQRDDLLSDQPEVYYLTPHYESAPCVLVRLKKASSDALQDLLRAAWQDASAARRPAAARRSRVRR